jgi:hypothetical protein
LACLCLLGLAAFLGGGAAATAATAECPNAAIRGQQGSSFLPDCRAYEMVSPVEKGGSMAAINGEGVVVYARASTDGDRITYYSSGPMGDPSPRGIQFFTQGSRTGSGWTNRNAIPGPEQGITVSYYNHLPASPLLAADGSGLAFAGVTYVAENPQEKAEPSRSNGAYLTTPDGPIQWLTKPQTEAAQPRPGQLSSQNIMHMVGGSNDLSTMYFQYCGTLTSADTPRAGRTNYGFYVSHDGQVSTAGTLPDGSVDPDGAQWAGPGKQFCGLIPGSHNPSALGNQVSEDGTRAMFVSPDPTAKSGRPTELYVHRQGASSVLISRSEITGEAAPSGVVPVGTPTAFATPTGSHVFFATKDRLTEDAPTAPSVASVYRFAAATGDLEYLAGVPATIDAVSNDGARVLFPSAPSPSSPNGGVALWSEGEIVPVGHFIQLPAGEDRRVRFSSDGSTLVFTASTPFEGGAVVPPGINEVYRYVLGQSGPPTCISCPASGTASGNAYLSNWSGSARGITPAGDQGLADARNVSPDARRVFFDSPDALVPSDLNGKVDVYEWSDGALSLISSGHSDFNSYLLDTSTSGDDVFFATAEGLDPADTDRTYDVYDARVGGGFEQARAVVCGGAECQPPPSPPPGSSIALSEALRGPGNPNQRAHAKKKHAKKKHAKKRRHSKQKHAQKKRHARASSSTTAESAAGKN